MEKKNSQRYILGLTGTNAAGKGTVASFLQSKGYTYHSLSDALRNEAEHRGMGVSRKELTQLGQQLREEEGPGVLASRSIPELQDGLHVVDSIRHPKEVNILRSNGHFLLLAIDADPKLRFERANKRGRDENAKTLNEFMAQEQKEFSKKETAQQIHNTMRLADETILNEGTEEELHKVIVEVLKKNNFPV